MKIKDLGAMAALGTLSLVVACSGGNNGALLGSTGALPNNMQPATTGVADPFAAKTPIKVSHKSLSFGSPTASARSVTITETKYTGAFKFASTCGKSVTFAPKKVNGPRATIAIDPHDAVTCTITVSDKAKNKTPIAITVNSAATPTPSPTPTSTATPTSSPTPGSGIVNGNFASGNLAPGWKACSFAHSPLTKPVSASPAPAGTAAQTLDTPAIAAATLAKYGNTVGTPPPNLNPNNSGAIPGAIGSDAAMTGDQNSQNEGAAGVCQTFTVQAAAHYLSFYAYEGGSEYSFEYADQEADILDSTGTTVQKTLFAEDNCFWDPGHIGATGYLNSGCIPLSDGSTSQYVDWQGGYWVQRGPYDLSAYAGKSVTLFLGVWDDASNNTPYPDTYSQEMWVTNVQMSASSTFPASFGARHR
jgi:hypothetical protein